MMIITHFQTALKQLLANKGKAALTMLGIVIGIGSVIYIMTLGEIGKNFLLSQISQFGTNVIEVAVAGDFGPFGSADEVTLTDDDVQEIEESTLLPELTGISAGYTTAGNVEHEGENYPVNLFGDREEYAEINNLNMLKGRFFTNNDVANGTRVAVIGENLANELFGSVDEAITETVSIEGNSFTVIGVTEDFATGGFGPSDLIYAPLSTVRRLFAEADEQNEISFLLVEFAQESNAESFQQRLEYELYRVKGLNQEDGEVFTVISRKQFISIFDTILLGVQAFVSAIAAISLVVGGIGIMNIMLVTVKERTKEIGLRKAVGAKNSSVLIQFLIESVVLTTVGGLIGIALGLGLSLLSVVATNAVQPDWGLQFVFVPNAILLACGVAVTTGIIFGLYPAWKASRLHPIESLRYE